MPKLLLTHTADMLANYYGERAVAALREICEVRLNETGAVLGADELIEHARGCEIVVSDRQTPGFGAFFDAAPDLVAFLRCAVDIRNIDVPAASRNGILVTRATPGFATSVAEMGLGFMIDLARGISGCVSAYRAGREPAAHRGRMLAGATLGIIGYGVIGVELATLARGLGMSVIVFDPHKRVEGAGVRQVAIETLLAQADFVVCLAVATSETENLMDAKAFACMRPDAYFINLSRGELVDEAALEAALAGGRIAGAAMDVGRAPDQKPSPKLASRADVVATPHIAGLTPEAVEHQAFDTVEQVRALVGGRLPEHAVNPEDAIRLSRLGARQKGRLMTEPAKPAFRPPPGACDTHIHIYDRAMPLAPTAVAEPPSGSVADYRALQERLGLDRVVVVQPSAYGTENRVTVDAVASFGLATARGVAVVDTDTPDAELARLTRAGTVGARFLMLPGGAIGWEQLDRIAARVTEHGWHVQLQLDGRSLPDRIAQITRWPGRIVIDHVGKFIKPVPVDHPGFRCLLDLLETGRVWVKLSAPYEVSQSGPPAYEDVGVLARALVDAAPERMLWASNWPHPSAQHDPPDDAQLLNLLDAWVEDAAVRDRILVANPAELYGFDGSDLGT